MKNSFGTVVIDVRVICVLNAIVVQVDPFGSIIYSVYSFPVNFLSIREGQLQGSTF